MKLKQLSKNSQIYSCQSSKDCHFYIMPGLSTLSSSLRQGSILHQGRYRRDARAMDEDEESWFDQEDDGDDPDPVVRSVDTNFRNTRVDPELDAIGRFIGMEGELEQKLEDIGGWLYGDIFVTSLLNR